MQTLDESDSEDKQEMWLHPAILSLVTFLGACLVLFHAVGIFGFIVIQPWKNMIAEFVISLLIGSWLLFVAIVGFARCLLFGTKYAQYVAPVPKSTRKSLLPPLAMLFLGLAALGFAIRVAFFAAGDYFLIQNGLPLLFVTVPLGCFLLIVSARGVNEWSGQ